MASKARKIVILTLAAVSASSCSALRPIEAPLPVCAAIGGVVGGTTAGVVANAQTDKGTNVAIAAFGGVVLGELIGGALCREGRQPEPAAVSTTPTRKDENP